jgi:prepilin-type processing-associated H-X9-DG protein
MARISGSDPEFNDIRPKALPRPAFRPLAVLAAVVGTIGLLIALCLPLLRSARPAAHRALCTNNLKQIGLALRNYARVYKSLPPAYTVDAHGNPLHSWRTLILPYLELKPLYDSIDLSKPWNDPANAKALETFVHVYRCPSVIGPQDKTIYLAVVGRDCCFLPTEGRRFEDITDGLSSTLMVIEASEEQAVPWMAPLDADESVVMTLRPATKLHHAGGTNVGFADGSVRFLKANTAPKLRRAHITISGNEKISAGEW